MKINKVPVVPYKQLIARTVALINKNSANTKEHNVWIQVKKKSISATAVQNSVLKGTFSIDLEESEETQEGEVYIKGESLNKMTSSLPDEPFVTISLNSKSQLVYKIPPHGAVSEMVFNDQNPFRGIQFYESKFKTVVSKTNQLSEIISLLNSSCTTSTQSWFVTEDKALFLYGQYAQSGFVKYKVEVETSSAIQLYLNHLNLKPVSYLGECSIDFNSKPKSLRFLGEAGEFILFGKEECSIPFKAIDIIEDLKATEITVNLTDLNKAVNWQSYGFQEGDGITLSLDEDKLVISGDRVQEAASINLIESNNFTSITLPTSALKSALKAIGKSEHVKLSVLNVHENFNALKLVPIKSDGFQATAILYEQCQLNR